MGYSHSLDVPNLHGIIIASTSQVYRIATPRNVVDALSMSFKCAHVRTIHGIPDHDIFIGRCGKSIRVRTCRFALYSFQRVFYIGKSICNDGSYTQKLGTRRPD